MGRTAGRWPAEARPGERAVNVTKKIPAILRRDLLDMFDLPDIGLIRGSYPEIIVISEAKRKEEKTGRRQGTG